MLYIANIRIFRFSAFHNKKKTNQKFTKKIIIFDNKHKLKPFLYSIYNKKMNNFMFFQRFHRFPFLFPAFPLFRFRVLGTAVFNLRNLTLTGRNKNHIVNKQNKTYIDYIFALILFKCYIA